MPSFVNINNSSYLSNNKCFPSTKPLWHKVGPSHISKYENKLNCILQNLSLDTATCILSCCDVMCTDQSHTSYINILCNDIVVWCLQACQKVKIVQTKIC